MPDAETIPEVAPAVIPEAAGAAGDAAPDVASQEPPHPLEPGGVRFSEVYADMQHARREAARLQAELDAARHQVPAPTQQPAFYTPQQLQGMLDQGQITPAVMTAQIAWQERQIAKQEMRVEFSQAERARAASHEVQQYMDRVPKLIDRASDEFRRVDRINREMADELGLTPDDPRVQRRALQLAFGPLDKLQRAKAASDTTQSQSETYVEAGGGGGSVKVKADPLKDIPAGYKQHWERMGYTREQMLEEAKFIRPTPRQRVGLWRP